MSSASSRGGASSPDDFPRPPERKRRTVSVFPGPDGVIPPDLAEALLVLEARQQRRLLILADDINDRSLGLVMAALNAIPRGEPVALMIDSPGGYARSAYQIARLLHKHCGGYTAVVPRAAKSAATLLALGADQVVMHELAELGPLDAQVLHSEREEMGSALDEVTAVERLHALSLTLIDSTMMLLAQRSGKRTDVLLPHALRFIAETTRPLYEKIDAVHLTAMSRVLAEAKEYATRLLRRTCPDPARANEIARRLVYSYPEHGFVIDAEEARGVGIEVAPLEDDDRVLVNDLVPHLADFVAVGFVMDVAPTADPEAAPETGSVA